MSQTNPPPQTSKPRRSSLGAVAIGGLVLVALLSLAFAGYTALNSRTVTVTEQQMLTNTQSQYFVQTQAVTSASTATSYITLTNAPPNGYAYGNYQSCYYYGCYQGPGYYYNNNPGYYPGYYGNDYSPCQSTQSSGSITCSGYLYEAQNGCSLLAISTTNNPYPSYATTYVYEYYSLHNLPSNTLASGTWVTVSGQMYQGYNISSNGNSCPNNYINVNSIT
jgi:hypothetical protein